MNKVVTWNSQMQIICLPVCPSRPSIHNCKFLNSRFENCYWWQVTEYFQQWVNYEQVCNAHLWRKADGRAPSICIKIDDVKYKWYHLKKIENCCGQFWWTSVLNLYSMKNKFHVLHLLSFILLLLDLQTSDLFLWEEFSLIGKNETFFCFL